MSSRAFLLSGSVVSQCILQPPIRLAFFLACVMLATLSLYVTLSLV